MTDLPVPAVTPPETPQPSTLVCANCHARLDGEYCSACGQRHEPHIHTVAHFAGEAFESISHADSRLWRTLWYLFSRPVSVRDLLPLLERLPAQCQELEQAAQKLPGQSKFATRQGERRRGPLSLVAD